MSGAINILVRSFLQKQSLEECSLEELQALASEYPYSDAAQLLLAKKLYAAQATAPGIAEKFDEQLQKTLLLFQNPLWVQHLINEREIDGVKMVGEEVEIEEPQPLEEDQPFDSHEPEEVNVIDIQEPVMPEVQNDKPEDLPIRKSEPEIVNVEKDSALTFEPFHTVDYFASQGIKYTPEEVPKDKFSQQLKSFTEWLKAMKRLPVTESDLPKDEVVGKQVEQLAQHSIEDREVVTETMAEVWGKQGNRLKAIEVYEKLSLLDPSKSSYFAAKIESLKIQ